MRTARGPPVDLVLDGEKVLGTVDGEVGALGEGCRSERPPVGWGAGGAPPPRRVGSV